MAPNRPPPGLTDGETGPICCSVRTTGERRAGGRRPRNYGTGYARAVPFRIFLGHGASGTSVSMAPFVRGLAERDMEATAIDLPKRKAEEAVPAFHRVVPSASDVVVGGHSYGGRVASLAAAEPGAPYGALLLFSYPLHPPGSPERAAARTEHWPRIDCPVLLLSGASDPFAKVDLLRAAVGLLPKAELVTYPKLGHTLKPVLDDVLDRVVAFLRDIEASG
jgi:pimeloyl-ACP methyl ester carboxylesterase